MTKIVVSACLLGENCKYNGKNNRNDRVLRFVQDKDVIPVCPEILAGLGVPRTPIEIVNGKALTRDGQDVDAAIRVAVAQIRSQLEGEEIECAILQSRSPTCGSKQVYDGTFSGTLIAGEGILAEALRTAGIRVIDAEDI